MFKSQNKNVGFLYGILAAILFGSSIPFAKVLVKDIHPWLLAGLFYLGSSIGIFILYLIQKVSKSTSKEPPLSPKDWKWLQLALLIGGIIAPIFMMFGIQKTPASSASLLLNLESVFTAIIAWVIFKEHVDFKIGMGMILIVVASVILSWSPNPQMTNYLGSLFIVAACLCWGMDNNLTRKISIADPLQISLFKCFIAGGTNTVLALLFVQKVPSLKMIFIACIVGFIGYGLSLVFYVIGLRHVGAARTGAYFSLAPFVGAGMAIIFLNESLTLQFVGACFLMAIGIWIHISEYHEHEHIHEVLEHEHSHTHDEHHQHLHDSNDPTDKPHTHVHKHEPIRHSHPHFPDVHHRHKH